MRKDFSNNSTASVSVTLTCTSGTVTNNPRLASEAAPAVFTISGATAGTTCKATEPTVPSGYTRNQTDCQNGDPLNGSCTIVNTLNTTSSNTFTVRKDFSNNNPASVSVTLTCTSGTIATNPKLASEGAPAVFSISGATAGTTCKATEPTVPSGYTRNQTDCQNGDPLNGSCTIVNTAISNPGRSHIEFEFRNGPVYRVDNLRRRGDRLCHRSRPVFAASFGQRRLGHPYGFHCRLHFGQRDHEARGAIARGE